MREALRRAGLPPRLGRLGRTTLLSTGALVTRALLQAAYLVGLSRYLGAEGYGLFAGSVAAVVLLAPLANGGMGYVFTERHARTPALAVASWRTASRLSVLSGMVFAVLVTVVATSTMSVRVAVPLLFLLAIAELLLLPWALVATQALLALDRGRLAAVAMCAIPAGRVAFAFLLIAGGTQPSVQGIVLTHVAGSIVGVCLVTWMTQRAARAVAAPIESTRLASAREWFREGWPFAAAALAANAYFEVDKLLVLQLVDAHASGVYTAAFRVVAMFLLPVMALLASALPRAFAASHTGHLRPMIAAATGSATAYGVLAAIGVWLASPLVPWLFGAGFEATASIAAALAPWLPLFALHHCGALALVADGAKTLRLVIDATGLALVVALNVALLPHYGVMGAVFALIAVEAAMAMACWAAFALRRRAR